MQRVPGIPCLHLLAANRGRACPAYDGPDLGPLEDAANSVACVCIVVVWSCCIQLGIAGFRCTVAMPSLCLQVADLRACSVCVRLCNTTGNLGIFASTIFQTGTQGFN
jgi:hypothetical protein